MLRRAYDLVMDPEQNPLSNLPKMVRFQYLLILSYIWSTAFTIWVGTFFVLGPTIVGHTAVLIATFFTADVFRHARRQQRRNRNGPRDPGDGTVLFDDLWGAPQLAVAKR